MFFEDISQVQEIALKCGTAVFVVPDEVPVEIPGALVIQPEEKIVITIEQVRQVMGILELKQRKDIFILIRPAEKMQIEAANAFLKSLEEPGDKIHYLLITNQPTMLLPTILSRASLFFLRVIDDGTIHADLKVKELAKRLMVAKSKELLNVADEIVREKERTRAFALEVVGVAIEILYKTYYITNKNVFITKLTKFLTLYDCLLQNGHIKLQIVANLI